MTQPFIFWRPGPDLDESHKKCKSHLVLGATLDVLILTQSGDKGGGGIGLIQEKKDEGVS